MDGTIEIPSFTLLKLEVLHLDQVPCPAHQEVDQTHYYPLAWSQNIMTGPSKVLPRLIQHLEVHPKAQDIMVKKANLIGEGW